MKKVMASLMIITTILSLTACTKTKEYAPGTSFEKKTESKQSSDMKSTKNEITYEGIIIQKNDAPKDSTTLTISNIKITAGDKKNAIHPMEDPEFKKDVIIFHIPEKNKTNIKNAKKNDTISITTDNAAIATMSIPPQVAGNSILRVKIIK